MGVGFVLVVEKSAERAVIEELAKLGETTFPLGYIEKASRQRNVTIAFNL